MPSINRFEDIKAWQEARSLALEIDTIGKQGELAKDFGLRDQMRRSAVSSPSNIAEGFGREGNQECMRFLKIAKGSSGEFRSQLFNVLDSDHIDLATFDSLYSKSEHAERPIGGFISYLGQHKRKATQPKTA